MASASSARNSLASVMGLAPPFAAWPRGLQLLLCGLLLVASVAFGRHLQRIAAPIEARFPPGIVGLETLGSSGRAAQANEILGEAYRAEARRHTRHDFVFIVLYALGLSLACSLVAGATAGRLSVLAGLCAWAVLFAGGLDAIENLALLRVLSGHTEAPWPQLSTVCATLKFAILLGAAACVALGLLSMARAWLRTKT